MCIGSSVLSTLLALFVLCSLTNICLYAEMDTSSGVAESNRIIDIGPTYKAAERILLSNQYSHSEKVGYIEDILRGDDFLKKFDIIHFLFGLYLGHENQGGSYLELRDLFIENMISASNEHAKSQLDNGRLRIFVFETLELLRRMGVEKGVYFKLLKRDDVPLPLKKRIEVAIIEIQYNDLAHHHDRSEKIISGSNIGMDGWQVVKSFITSYSSYTDEDLNLQEHIKDWQESVFQDAMDAYGKMTPEARKGVWDYLREALASDDDEVRYRGLMGCQILAHDHFDEIKSIRDEMYGLLSEYEDDCGDFPRKQRLILILSKYFLAKGFYEEGDITKDEFDSVSEKSKKWLYGK